MMIHHFSNRNRTFKAVTPSVRLRPILYQYSQYVLSHRNGLVFLWSIVSPKDIIPFDEYRKFRIHTVAFESQC